MRQFFLIGTTKAWFNIDDDIIRTEDYPKRYKENPDPLSNNVREQIEQNLHKLPEPIARMWIICFFAAMRPNELALLKQDCLIQEGEGWKLVWEREKSNDHHEIMRFSADAIELLTNTSAIALIIGDRAHSLIHLIFSLRGYRHLIWKNMQITL